MKLASIIALVFVAALPAFAQQASREEFREYCQAMAGRWVGDVTWITDWPGFGKRGDKVTGYAESKLAEDGHALVGRFFGGAGSSSWITIYDAGSRQIRSSGSDSGGTTWVAIIYKQDGRWVSAETGSLADGRKTEGIYTLTVSDNGNTHRWSGSTRIGGKAVDDLQDVWRRVSQ